MAEIFPELIAKVLPSLALLLIVLLVVWGVSNWKALNNPDDRAFKRLLRWLRENSFGQWYLWFLGGLMDRMGDWIGDRHQLSQVSMTSTQSHGLVQRVFGFNPFTAQSYEKCLWLAFLYPLLAYLLAWTMGAEGQIGNTSLFDQGAVKLSLGQRWLIIGGILLLIATVLWPVLSRGGWKFWLVLAGVLLLTAVISNWLGEKRAIIELLVIFVQVFLLIFIPFCLGGWVARWVKHRPIEIYKQAFSVAAAAAAVSVAAIAIVGAGAASAAVTAAIAVALALVVTVIMVSTLKDLGQWSRRKGNLYWVWIIYSLFLISAGAVSLNINAHSISLLFVLFCLLLPLVNAPLDWLSLGVTRGLLQAVRTGNLSGWRTLVWAAVDLLLAFFFLFLITAVLVGVTALGNAMAGKTLVGLGCILNNLEADASQPDHWWIYFMLLSTLVPTLCHFALAGGAATLWLPRQWRTRLAEGLEEDTQKILLAWAYLTFTPVIGFILMPLALLWSLWWLLNMNGGELGALLLGWAMGLAKLVDPSMALLCT